MKCPICGRLSRGLCDACQQKEDSAGTPGKRKDKKGGKKQSRKPVESLAEAMQQASAGAGTPEDQAAGTAAAMRQPRIRQCTRCGTCFRGAHKVKSPGPSPVRFVCPTCSRQTGQYFEAILQLRGDWEDAANEARTQVHVAKQVMPRGGGVDLYTDDTSKTRAVAKRLAKKFGGNVVETAKLHTQDHLSSKKLYRMTFLITVPPFHSGDIVALSDVKDKAREPIIITKVDKHVHGTGIATGRHYKVNPDEAKEGLPIVKTQVSISSPRLEVLHPESYSSVEPVMREGQEIAIVKDRIRVVVHRGVVYAVPRDQR